MKVSQSQPSGLASDAGAVVTEAALSVPLRDRLARIIDPHAFERHAYVVAHYVRAGRSRDDALAIANTAWGQALKDTYAKADAATAEAGLGGMLHALEVARHALVATHNLRATDLYAETFDAHLANGVPRDTLEWFIDHTADLAVVDAAIAKTGGQP